jgi:hypothetical protein
MPNIWTEFLQLIELYQVETRRKKAVAALAHLKVISFSWD